MSKHFKKLTKNEELSIKLSEFENKLLKIRYKEKENLYYEMKLLLICLSVLFSSTVFLHKDILQNYNFKLILLLSFYFSRRLLKKIWYYYRIKEKLLFPLNNIIFLVIIAQAVLNLIYISIDLLQKFTLFQIFSLVYISILQLPLFHIFPSATKRYENSSKEFIFIIRSNILI